MIKDLINWSEKIYNCGIDIYNNYIDDLVEETFNSLEEIMQDQYNHDIRHWCYDLDFGKNLKESFASIYYGNITIRLSLDSLWNILIIEILSSLQH